MPGTSDAWRQRIAELEAQRDQQRQAHQRLAESRREFALSASSGDAKASAAVRRINDDLRQIRDAIDVFDMALDEAAKELAAAQRREFAASERARRARLRAAAERRVEKAKAIDAAIEALRGALEGHAATFAPFEAELDMANEREAWNAIWLASTSAGDKLRPLLFDYNLLAGSPVDPSPSASVADQERSALAYALDEPEQPEPMAEAA